MIINILTDIFKKVTKSKKAEELECEFHGRLGTCKVKFGSKELYDKIKKNSEKDKNSSFVFK